MSTVDIRTRESGEDERRYWIELMPAIASPVLTALANRRLHATMPVETNDREGGRAHCSHLEAFARTLMGIAPWLERGADDPVEEGFRATFASLARSALEAATDSDSVDRMNFGAPNPDISDSINNQALVDTAFLAQALLRAPNALWRDLPRRTKANVVTRLTESRRITPGPCNWLLFSAEVEAALAMMGREADETVVDRAIRAHELWYAGDGAYGDGPEFHWDYYNSFVIQPMILDVLGVFDPTETGRFGMTYSTALARSKRYAIVLERLISPEGTIPPIGRSLAYRMGALQTLAQLALVDELPAEISPAQARSAMTSVIKRLMNAPDTFDENGWLRIGFCGHQPALGESYISTGSLYLCCAAFLPLGLPPAHPFWSGPFTPWTSLKIYCGEDVAADHAS
jgi:hypothetical protein